MKDGCRPHVASGDEARRCNIALLSLVVAFTASALDAQPTPATSLRDAVDTAQQHWMLPAVAAAAVSSEQLLDIHATGIRRLDSAGTVLQTDQFHMGSLTKAMTATLLAVLVEEGLIAWESRLIDVFPEIETSAHVDHHLTKVEDLVTHRAGFAPYSTLEEFAELQLFVGTPVEQRLAFTHDLLTSAADVPQGTYVFVHPAWPTSLI